MLHLRYKPLDFFYTHLSYTQALSRPNFGAISPNTYIDTGFQPFTHSSTNPNLNPEWWQNFDAQVTFHNDKIGLLSVTGFYKTVEDKIWSRSYKRIAGDPIIEPFTDKSVVNVGLWENHDYDIFLKGIEAEWQTNFHYLSGFLSKMTLSLNYTFTDSETQYPYTRIDQVIPEGGGRPVPVRIDSTTVGSMLFQPKHVGNFSLGYADKRFNIWTSFQYNGLILTGYNQAVEELEPLKEHFYRLDFQMTYGIPIKKSKLEFILYWANLSNYLETSRLRGDSRSTYEEQYGWTLDFSVRYKF